MAEEAAKEPVNVKMMEKAGAATPALTKETVKLDDAGTTPVDSKISKDKAIALAKQYVQIPAGFELQNVSFSKQYSNGRGVWNISYVKKEDKNRYYAGIDVGIDADNGMLLSFYSNINDPDKKYEYPPKVNLQAAKTVADQFIAKIIPGKQAELRYDQDAANEMKTPLNGNVQYRLQYDRIVGDIPYLQNYVSLTVDGEGHVVQYTYNWDDEVQFDKADKYISQQEAEAAFREQAQLMPNYLLPYRQQGVKKPYVSYNLTPFMLDAATGKRWTDVNSGYKLNTTVPVADKALAEPPKTNQNLTKEQAVERVKALFKVDGTMKLEDASYNESTNPETGIVSASWNLRWTKPEGNGDAWASVDSKTGQVTNFSNYFYFASDSAGKTDNAATKLTYDQAKSKAVELVKKALPHWAHQLYLQEQDMSQIPAAKLAQMNSFGFNFKRILDGIGGMEDINISIDMKTGDVTNYYGYQSGIAYPDQAPNLITKEQAADLLFSQYRIKLGYVLPYTDRDGGIIPLEKYNLMVAAGEIMPGKDQQNKKAKLVYQLVPLQNDQNVFLDATTGEWRAQDSGDVTSLEKVQVTDIDKHWAQKELELMLEYKALDVKDGKVNPDAPITRGELIKMLIASLNGGGPIYYESAKTASFADVKADSQFFAYVETAVDRNLIDRDSKNFNPDGKMSREEVAELIVRALGFNPLAQYSDIFALSAKDADAIKHKGQVAIVVGLGIMSLSDGKFGPEQQVTRAQAATAFFRFLQKRETLANSPDYGFR